MPYGPPDYGPPLVMNPWCLLYIVLTIGLAIWQWVVGHSQGGHQPDQEPYAGHHYQRRQAKKMFK
jgi:hypothetical protein